MMLDGIMVDCVRSIPSMVTVGCVRSKASVRPYVSYEVIMHVIVKGSVFYFIFHGHTKNGVVLCESHQYWFEFGSMYKTQMPHVNVMKKFRWEVIKLCAFLYKTFSWAGGSF